MRARKRLQHEGEETFVCLKSFGKEKPLALRFGLRSLHVVNVQLLEQRENMFRTQRVKGFGEERGGMKPRNLLDFQEVQNL